MITIKEEVMKELPSSCSECDFYYQGACNIRNAHISTLCDTKKERHPQCPLQDTTELLEAL